MTSSKIYDLEERTLIFATNVRKFVRIVPKDICNMEDCRQLLRSSGSVGANYIEANEALSKKDIKKRMKISRKESKEARYRLKLIDTKGDKEVESSQRELIQESTELLKILSSIINKTGQKVDYSYIDLCILFVIWNLNFVI